MNDTFKVATAMDCSKFTPYDMLARADPLMRINYMGCRTFSLLLYMYELNVTYVNLKTLNGSTNYEADVFIVPRLLSLQILENSHPIFPILNRRYGFILRQHHDITNIRYYSLPFQRSVWNVLYAICLFISILFYLLNGLERRIVPQNTNRECSFFYELLLAIGAYCQRVPHIKAKLWSRRMAYTIFITFGYLVHCYYTSNLLSCLVKDRDSDKALVVLVERHYELAVLDNMSFDEDSALVAKHNTYFEEKLQSRFTEAVKMDILTALGAIMSGRFAVFSDYITLYPFIRRYFDDEEICDLIHVDMYTDIKKYFFTSKEFPYIEQFKVGALRLKEAGLLQRLKTHLLYTRPTCPSSPPVVPSLRLVAYPFILLSAACVSSLLVLGMENLHYNYVNNRKPRWSYIN
ncbi:ionotropic receptor 75a-like [Hyposmocoma kahamanoa]|uniref:ionotropic receptor 75a-like n=1 Tax=Hyposmocoma kahamanoa TaxID=1477025 RepID=UPI000E6D996F|nr:ionotropic receptor 75a-like [Hyposmocoma kahamanoa]